MKPYKSVCFGCAHPAPVPKHIYFTILLEYSQKASEYSCWLITITGNFNYIERKALFGHKMGWKWGASGGCHTHVDPRPACLPALRQLLQLLLPNICLN